MRKYLLKTRQIVAAMAIASAPGFASAATIDIEVSDVTVTNANIVITPSDDEATFYYGLMTAEDFNAKNGEEGIVDDCISSWEEMGSWYNKIWIEMLPSVLYTGSQSFTGKEFKIVWDTEYVVYAFGMDSQTGEVTIPVVTNQFKTLELEHSDNTFSITVDKVTPTEGTSFYMDVTVTVTPTNDDPYAVLVQQSSILDFYDGSDETKTMDAYFANQFVNYVTETYTGQQTLTFNRQRKGKDMYVVVAGFNGGPTTDLYKLAFRTDETPVEPEKNFDIAASDITLREAIVSFTPSDNDIHYFRSVLRKDKFFDENNGAEGIYDFDKSWFEFLASITTDKTWNEIFYENSITGESIDQASELFGANKLDWGTDFVAYAYGINEDGEIITPVSYIEFSTLPRNNNTDLTFDLSVLDITQDEGKSTYTAQIRVIPSTSDNYAKHYHGVEFYDWYIDNPDYTWEDYLITQFDKYIYETYCGENVFECKNIKKDQEYYFVVTGYENEAPSTDIFKIRFKGEDLNGVGENIDNKVSLNVVGGTVSINGAFDYGCIYTADGKAMATFRTDMPSVNLPCGAYIVEIVSNGVKKIEKILVR